jgi:hypothetical protein
MKKLIARLFASASLAATLLASTGCLTFQKTFIDMHNPYIGEAYSDKNAMKGLIPLCASLGEEHHGYTEEEICRDCRIFRRSLVLFNLNY